MRVALYARYSSDRQRSVSIEDQFRLGREDAAAAGWTIVDEHPDPAVSGASMLQRPGFQALIRGIESGRYDIVWAEDLDRISRDLADPAIFYRKAKFAGVQIVTRAEGPIGPLHIGLKGTMNAMFLDALAQKTSRGLRGRVEAGKSAGGVSYGYRVVRVPEGAPRGDLEIDTDQARVVERVFRQFAGGISPKVICRALNTEGIPGPRGAAWSPSTIHGNFARCTGILNNELYVGRRIWNRLKYEKNPDTGKRISRLNPRAQWVIKSTPELRVVDDDLWQAVKARQLGSRHAIKTGIVRARRPKYLFSGLTTCGACGGGYTSSSRNTLVCFNARERGTCTNRRSIKRQDVEARVLCAMRERLFDPGVFAAFWEEFTAEMERLRREHVAERAKSRRELAAVEKRQREILKALADGFRTEAWKAELVALDEQKAALTAAMSEPQLPALHPDMAAVFRQKATTLAAGLEHDDHRDTAREALRGFVEQIVIPPGDELLKVVGKLGAMLEAATELRMPGRQAVGINGCGGRI